MHFLEELSEEGDDTDFWNFALEEATTIKEEETKSNGKSSEVDLREENRKLKMLLGKMINEF